METSLYIHIPFCRSKCNYCNFYSIPYKESMAVSYVDVLLKQIEQLEGNFSTIYIGGGAPTVIGNQNLERLLKSLNKRYAPGAEFTVEANPDSLDNEKLSLLLNEGVNRISIGAQSFNNAVLQKLGRAHTAEEAEEAVNRANKKGFTNISIDLMFGIWGQTQEEWSKELEYAVKFPITHISCYSLTYEKNTKLSAMIGNGEIIPLEDETSAKMYEYVINYLPEKDFGHYEVSSFCKDNYPCRHNIHYWENNYYVGLGASSVSYLDGVRKANVSNVEEYINRAINNETFISYEEKLSPDRKAKETAALKIRTSDGIGFLWFKNRTGYDFLDIEGAALKDLFTDKLIANTEKSENNGEEGVALTKKGFLFCDAVSSALL